eukprot:scaffold1318_cov362-Pavlova_lutheri.AAC.21
MVYLGGDGIVCQRDEAIRDAPAPSLLTCCRFWGDLPHVSAAHGMVELLHNQWRHSIVVYSVMHCASRARLACTPSSPLVCFLFETCAARTVVPRSIVSLLPYPIGFEDPCMWNAR